MSSASGHSRSFAGCICLQRAEELRLSRMTLGRRRWWSWGNARRRQQRMPFAKSVRDRRVKILGDVAGLPKLSVVCVSADTVTESKQARYSYLRGMVDFKRRLACSVKVSTVAKGVVFANKHLLLLSICSSPLAGFHLPLRCSQAALSLCIALHCTS